MIQDKSLAIALIGLILGGCSISNPDQTTSSQPALSSSAADYARLTEGFAEPPKQAKPLVWWHWLDGNVSKDGITADLNWMKESGVAGIQWFDVSAGVDQYLAEPIEFGSPQWQEMIGHAVSEVDRLGLDMTIHASAGWSQTGGPWVEPHQAMKKLVWSETILDAASSDGHIQLNPLPNETGPYQNVPVTLPSPLPRMSGTMEAIPVEQRRQSEPFQAPSYSRDQLVLAVRKTENEQALDNAVTSIKVGQQDLTVSDLSDQNYTNGIELSLSEEPVIVEISFENPVMLNGVKMGVRPDWPSGRIEVFSDDNWRTIAELPGEGHFRIRAPARTFGFQPVLSTRMRVILDAPPPVHPLAAVLGAAANPALTLTELKPLALAVNRVEAKSGFEIIYDYDWVRSDHQVTGVDKNDVIDLTDRMDSNGVLTWTPPAGEWTILRLGYSLTGAVNQPATRAGRGLEVDKLNAEYVETYLKSYLDLFAQSDEDVFGSNKIDSLLLDSWEAKTSNWTDGILQEFERLRGYDPTPFVPALAGFVIVDSTTTDQFLWDWRLTLSDLLAEAHNQTISKLLADREMKLYAESMGARMWVIGDGMKLKGLADYPMAEFWYSSPGDLSGVDQAYITDIREAASVANIYGKPFVAAESFTTPPTEQPWGQGPRDLKWVADYFMAQGASRFVFHSSDHQPFDDRRPGLTLWEIGQFLTRHESWADHAHLFFDYLARASFMLQEGLHQADILVFLGEGAPVTLPFWDPEQPGIPWGYDYDYLDATTLLTALEVENGQFKTPAGTVYEVLFIPETVEALTVPAVTKLSELIESGGTVVSAKPAVSPSLMDSVEDVQSAEAIIEQLWQANLTDETSSVQPIGSGRVVATNSIEDALNALRLAPDISSPSSAQLGWDHRRVSEIDIYFIANLGRTNISEMATLRARRKNVEIWYPEDGRMAQAVFEPTQGETRVQLDLAAFQSAFILMHDLEDDLSKAPLTKRVGDVIARVETPWNVTFSAPNLPSIDVKTEQLFDWSTSERDEIRYHSGVGIYQTSFELPNSERFASETFWLDLGEVHQIARVSVNGRDVGSDWIAPYGLPIEPGVLRAGTNDIEIEVVNLWANRLIGDAQIDADASVSKTPFRPYTQGTVYAAISRSEPDESLLPSGLVGPVKLHRFDPAPGEIVAGASE